MDLGDDHYGGGFLGSSSFATPTPGKMTNEAGEAFLISQATNTATIAARSILMSGGTEETALKTAKAAAQSVLNPQSSENDSVSAKGTGFLRRRKAKRQAEVVASMALVSATSKLRSGSQDWEMISVSEQSHQFQHQHQPQFQHPHLQQQHPLNMMQYPSNVAFNTFAMKGDDPSVLSGSQRSPKRGPGLLPPRAPSKPDSTKLVDKIDKKPPRAPSRVDEKMIPKLNSQLPPLSKQSSRQSLKVTKTPSLTQPVTNSAVELPGRTNSKRQAPTESRKNLVASVQDEDPIYCNGSQEDENNKDMGINSIYIPSSESGDDEETVDTLTTNGDNTSDKQRRAAKSDGSDFIQQHIDPVLTSFTNAFNAFSCGPLTAFVEEPEGPKTPKARRDRRSQEGKKDQRDDAEEQLSESGEETDAGDDETKLTNGTDGRDMESKPSYDSEMKHPMSGSRSTSTNSEGSSVDSERIIQELNMSSSTEGEIKVRSSIRETMEKIVSKSKQSVDADGVAERTWLSYELRQGDNPQMNLAEHQKPQTSTHKKKNKMKTKTMKPTTVTQFPSGSVPSEDKATTKKGWFRTKSTRKHKIATKHRLDHQGSF